MLTREECIAHAIDCEDLAAQLKVYGGGAGLMQAAAIWRNMAERMPSFQVGPNPHTASPIERTDTPKPRRMA